LDYSEPVLQDSPAGERGRRARRTVAVGLIVFVVSMPLLFSPMVIGAKVGRFVVAPAVVGVCWGLSCLLHGGWDWWRDRSA
jgi:hypothetical protein